MKLKPPPLQIPESHPFQFDVLERKAAIETLSSIVQNLHPPFVICIDSPWGTGKTTFLRLWEVQLKSSNLQVLYFDAWSTDFAGDPLVAFVSEIAALVKKITSNDELKQKHIDRAKQVATAIVKRALPVAAKLATAGLLNLDDFSEHGKGDRKRGQIYLLAGSAPLVKGCPMPASAH